MADAMDWHSTAPPNQTPLFFQPIATSTPNPAPNQVAAPPTSRLFTRFQNPPKLTSPKQAVPGEWPGSPSTIKRRYSEIDPEPEPYWWWGEGGKFYEAGPVTRAGKALWATAVIAADDRGEVHKFVYRDLHLASRFAWELGKEVVPALAEVVYDAGSAAAIAAYTGTNIAGHYSYKRIKVASRGLYTGSKAAGRDACQAGQVAGAYGAYAGDRFVVQPIIEIIRRHIAARRANRRKNRQQNPLPQLSQSPFRRALDTRQGHAVAPREPIEAVKPTAPSPLHTSKSPVQAKTPWQVVTTSFSTTPEVDDDDDEEGEHPQIRTSAGPTNRRLFVKKTAQVGPDLHSRKYPKRVTRPKQLPDHHRKNINKLQRDRRAYKSKYRGEHPASKNQEPTTAPVQVLTAATNSAASQHQIPEPTPQPFLNQLTNLPRLSSPEDAQAMRSKTLAQVDASRPPPCPILKTPFPQMDPLGIEQPAFASAPDSPGTQLMQELKHNTRDESDSDISSTLDIAWIPKRRGNKQSITVKDSSSAPVQTSGTEPSSTVKTPQRSSSEPVKISELKPKADGKAPQSLSPTSTRLTQGLNGAIQTPQSGQGRFKGRSYLDSNYSDISSTCNFSPGPIPELPIVSSDDAPELAVVISDDRIASYLGQKSTSAQAQTSGSPQAQTPASGRVQTRSSSRVSAEGVIIIPDQLKTPASGSLTTEFTAAPTPILSTLEVLEQSIAKPKNIHALTAEQVITPKAKRHSAEKTGRVTRAQKKAQEAKDDVANYTLAPLNVAQLAIVEQAIRRGHGKLSATDLARVVPQAGTSTSGTAAWLNDETINEYLQLVVAHGKLLVPPTGSAPSHHAFNSFFYSNLESKGPDAVKRWAQRAKVNGKNLLDAKFIFIPINSGSHWTLCVVSGRDKTITHYNSLPGDGRRHLRAVTNWVKAELGSAWVEEEWTVGSGESPQQMNSDDCGVFTVTNARQLMLGVLPGFGADDVPLQRRRMVAELVAGELLKGVSGRAGLGEE